MGSELVPGNKAAATDLDIFKKMGSDNFLARLQLFSGRSDAVGEGRIKVNHWGLVDDDDIIDLDDKITIGILAGRHKAIDTGDDFQCSHDPDSDLFKDLVERSAVSNSGCMYGPEFLVYLPMVSKFATLFMGSKTARREAKKFRPLMNKPAYLKSKLISTPKYKWQGPVILPCDEAFDLPPMEEVQAEIAKFLNPPKNETEVADDTGRDR